MTVSDIGVEGLTVEYETKPFPLASGLGDERWAGMWIEPEHVPCRRVREPVVNPA